MSFVRRAALPDCAEIVLIGEKYAEILDKPLKKLCISVKYIPNNPNVDPRLSGHADLSILHAGGERLYFAPYLRGTALHRELSGLGADIRIADIGQSALYPNDAQLNLCAVGNQLLCNRQTAAQEIVRYFTIDCGASVIYVKQGYTRCSICPAGERSIITADRGIAAAAKNAGMDVLLISPGHIVLDGFDTGFIGGASFCIAKDKIAFTGTLDRHPDKERIIRFLADRSIEPVFLTDRPIFDIGSAISLTER